MITYNDIYEALRKEKYSEVLQPISKRFILEVAEYLKDKKEITENKDDLFSDSILKSKKQLENAVSIFRELMLRRKKKLLNLAFIARETGVTKRDFDNMLDSEKEMFDKIVKSMEESDKTVADMLGGKKSVEKSNKMIMFKDNVEEFMDLTGELLGPFEKGEVANLSEEVVKILQDSGKAEVIEN